MMMTLTQFDADTPVKKRNLSAAGRVVLSGVIEGIAGEASRAKLRRLFYSPLGVYVSQALREQDRLVLEFDIAAIDLDFTLRMLQTLLPDAVINDIRPRVFNRNKH